MKSILKKVVYSLVNNYKREIYTIHHKRELKNYLKDTGIVLNTQSHEQDFGNKWTPIYGSLGKVSLGLYRFYSHYIGDDPNIITDDVFHVVVEPCLNNQESISVYGDKNMFERLFPQDYFPVCVLRNMDGDYMDRDYHIIRMDNAEFAKYVTGNKVLQEKGRLIVKPTTETGGGAGVRLFKFDGKHWISNDGDELSLPLLEKQYRRNFIIQETIEPCNFVKQFNQTSYSTFRIFTYRSIVDDQPHFIGGYMRVGAKGSFKDNIWGGGYAVPITKDGMLGSFASDAHRKRYDHVNDVSLKEQIFKIPNWEKMLELCYDVAEKSTPNRLLSFDIMLDNNEVPRIIEYNIKNQTVTTVQTTSKPFFGEFTDEIIEYCATHLHKIKYPLVVKKQ